MPSIGIEGFGPLLVSPHSVTSLGSTHFSYWGSNAEWLSLETIDIPPTKQICFCINTKQVVFIYNGTYTYTHIHVQNNNNQRKGGYQLFFRIFCDVF